MRRSLAAVLLTSILVLSFLSGPSVSLSQKKTRRTAKSAPVSLASQRGVDTISAAQLKDYLSFIASDEMEGRDTPSRGLDTTAKFLAMNLSRWGFKPAGGDGTFFQKIALRGPYLEKTATKSKIQGLNLRSVD